MARGLFQHRWKHSLSRAVCLGVVASLLVATALQAAGADQQSPDGVEVVEPSAVTADDGGAWELGVHGTAGNLTQATAAERYGMWYWLNGWFTLRYSFAESTAWEEDFKRAALGGTENYYIDSVDLQFYVGHGAPALFTFDNTAHDDSTLSAPNDCNFTWGDGDNEWLALTSCQVLADSGIGAMALCMNRQHLILGFVSNASAHNNYWDTQAYHFGRYLRYGYNMTQAWFNGCDVAQRGRVARVIAEEVGCFSDNPYYSSVCPDFVDNDYFWYTHSCGTPSAAYVPVEQLQNEVPVFKVDPYSLADAEADLSNLGGIFGIPVTATLQTAAVQEDVPPPAPHGDDSFFVSTNISKTLELDKGSGLYHFADLSQLWTSQQAEQAVALGRTLGPASANMLSQDDVRRIADAFLNQNQLMPSDAVFAEVVSDSVGELPKGVVAAETVQEAETPTNYQVIYGRQLPATYVTSAGVTQNITFTVVGPGAKQKVYLPLTGEVNAAGELQAEPLGVQGGWRSVSPQVNAASGQMVMTTILDVPTARALYLALDKEVTMNSIPLNISNRQILSETLAYWENAPGVSQGELIPVYEFTVSYTENDTGAAGQDLFYVPASPQYMRPIARILNAPVAIDRSAALTLTAADASKTLAELGLGDDFDFVMGYNGADGTYTYEWYFGSVAPENKITDLNPDDGATNITFNPPLSEDAHESTFDVVLVVTDTESPNASSSTAIVQIQAPTVFLPYVDQ